MSMFIVLLSYILLWYAMEDLVEDKDNALEYCVLGEEVLPLTSS